MMIRKMQYLLATVALVWLANATWAQDAKAARKIINQAIKAQGGAKKIAQHKIVQWKSKGTYYGMGEGVPYTGTWTIQLPTKVRMDIDGAFISVLNGDHGWVQMGGTTQPYTKEQLKEAKEGLYADWISTLLPLRKKGFHLKVVEGVTVHKKPTVGVKVSHKDHRDVTLYFDKNSHMLVKTETMVLDEQTKKPVKQESIFSDHKVFEGVKMASKFVVNRGGKIYVDGVITNYKVLDKAPAKAFDKP